MQYVPMPDNKWQTCFQILKQKEGWYPLESLKPIQKGNTHTFISASQTIKTHILLKTSYLHSINIKRFNYKTGQFVSVYTVICTILNAKKRKKIGVFRQFDKSKAFIYAVNVSPQTSPQVSPQTVFYSLNSFQTLVRLKPPPPSFIYLSPLPL